MHLIFNILTYYVSGDFVTYTPNKVPIALKLSSPQLLPQFREILKYLAGRHSFQYLHYLRWRVYRRYLKKYVHVVFHDFHRIYPELILLSNPLKHLFQVLQNLRTQYILPVPGYPHQVVLQIICSMLCPSNPHAEFIQGKVLFRQASLPRLMASHFPPPASWRVSSGDFYEANVQSK